MSEVTIRGQVGPATLADGSEPASHRAPDVSAPLLHIAAFWVDGDKADEIADFLKEQKIEGTRGAVVTFSLTESDRYDFRATMARLQLEEVNEHPPAPVS